MKLLSRIALAVAIVACLGAGFFAFELKGIRDGLRDDVAKLTTEKTKLTKDLADTRTDLVNTKQDLTKTRDDLTNTKGELEAAKVTLATKTLEADKLQASLNAKTAELTQVKADRDTVQQAIDNIKKSLADAGITDISNIAKLGDTIKSLTEESAILGKELAASRKDSVACKDKVVQLTTMPTNLRGHVAAVQDSWGFVVLDLGRDQRVQTNADFIVSRDDKMVAKVQVRTVGDNTSVAEILPGFPKTQPHVGDAVVHN